MRNTPPSCLTVYYSFLLGSCEALRHTNKRLHTRTQTPSLLSLSMTFLSFSMSTTAPLSTSLIIFLLSHSSFSARCCSVWCSVFDCMSHSWNAPVSANTGTSNSSKSWTFSMCIARVREKALNCPLVYLYKLLFHFWLMKVNGNLNLWKNTVVFFCFQHILFFFSYSNNITRIKSRILSERESVSIVGIRYPALFSVPIVV